MHAAQPSRAVLRQSRLLLRRNNPRQASTTSDAAAKAKDTASATTSKASEGLSRVTSSAGNIAGGAVSGARNALNKIGGRTGRLVAFVDSLIPPTTYYTRVGLQVAQLVFKGRNMTPPSLSDFQSAFQPLLNAVRTPTALSSSASSVRHSLNPQTLLSNLRNADRQKLVSYGIAGAEVLGFFTVGTMIGRMKVVGYHGGNGAGH